MAYSRPDRHGLPVYSLPRQLASLDLIVKVSSVKVV